MSLIIFLHGASSSGKTTLARAIRDASYRPYVQLSFDTFRDSGAFDLDRDWSSQRSRIFQGLHASFAAFADAGNDLIVEHILDDPEWHKDLQGLFAGHQVLFVGVHTDKDTLNDRERRRGDRPKGSAARDFDTVHRGLNYDVEVNGTNDPEANAAIVLAAVDRASQPSTFFSGVIL